MAASGEHLSGDRLISNAASQRRCPRCSGLRRCCNIRLPTSGGLYAWEFERDGRSVHVHVDGPFVLNDMRLLIDAALRGAGLANVTEDMVAPFIADGRPVQVLEKWSPPLSGYRLYYPNRRHPSPAFAALLGELRANSHLISRANI
jgi:DNA-binding transcriptional LysR family regulator